MNLKEVYLRLLKGQRVAGIRDEFASLIENCKSKKKLLDDIREGKISEEEFRGKFRLLFDIDDVLLSLEQKLIRNFPDSAELSMDLNGLRANIQQQREILGRKVLRLDQLRAVVAEQFYAIYEEAEHKREELERAVAAPLPEKKLPEPAEAKEAGALGWKYPPDFFVDDPWLKPQAAFDLFKDIIWDVYRLRTQKYEEDLLKGSVQAWADKHLVAPFPNIDAYISTLEMLSEKSKKHVRILGDIILEFRHMPDPVTLKDPSTRRIIFTERWNTIKRLIRKLPAELQAFVKPPADILSDFSEFLFVARGEEVEPLMARPVEVPEGESLRSAWSAPPDWFETDQTPLRRQKNAVNASYFLFLVSDSVVRLIDDLNEQPKVIEALAASGVPEPGNLGMVLARIARDQKKNRKVWSVLAMLSTSMYRGFKKMPVSPGFFAKRKLRKQRATLDRVWDSLPPEIHEFLQEPVAAIEDFFAQAGVTSKAA